MPAFPRRRSTSSVVPLEMSLMAHGSPSHGIKHPLQRKAFKYGEGWFTALLIAMSEFLSKYNGDINQSLLFLGEDSEGNEVLEPKNGKEHS